jgi:hypothetical protein
MEFNIKDCNESEFMSSLRQIEKITKPFNVAIFKRGRMEENNLSWSKLDWNTQSNGKKIFAIKKRMDTKLPSTDRAHRIPVGNYYVEFYFYRKAGKEQNVVGCVDLCWNENGEITRPGYHPVFLFQKTFESLVNSNGSMLQLYSIKETLRMAVKDRLKQVCSKKSAIPDPFLLTETINYVFKFSETDPGNKPNFGVKIANRVVFVNRATNKSGKYGFDWAMNPKGNFSDGLNSSSSVDVEALQDMITYFEDKGSGLVLGEASEEGGRKGNLVVLNKELQELRNPGKPVYHANYRDIMYGESPTVPGSVYSIYGQIEKFFTRIKGFITSDGCMGHNIEAVKVGMDGTEILFDRHRTYMAENPAEIGQLNPNVINMLVAYVPAENSGENITAEEFRNINKAEYSELLHGADCHIGIAKPAAELLVRVKRVISEPITEKHLSIAFVDAIKEIELNGVAEIASDVPIGYKVICELDGCNSIMTPVKATGSMSDETLEVQEIQADASCREWFCDICGNFTRQEPTPILICNKYQSAKSVNIYEVNINESEMGIEAHVEIISPINISRSISVEGIKGLTNPMSQDFIGFINGKILNPTTGEYVDVENVPIDLMTNLGAMKGKISGVGVSHARMQNAFTGSALCLDEAYRKDGSMNKVNAMLEGCETFQLSRRKYDIKKKAFTWVTEDVHVGMIAMDVTEIGDEFLKVKTDIDDMKVSYMNTLYYNWLGFDDLNTAMAKSSFENIEDETNLEFANELFKMFYGDPEGLPEVTHRVLLNGHRWDKSESDFNNPDGSVDIVSWLEKSEWARALEHHPLLKADSKFTNGAYFRDKQNNAVVFPSRKTIIRMVDVMNGDRVRLNGVVKDALGMFLDIYTKGWTPKLDSYKENIFKKLTGKQGVAARAATFVNYGCSGKEVGSGYIPPGVAVIGNNNFWKMVRKQCSKLGMNWNDINEGRMKIYGTSQRDPFIWIFQALNAVELWTVKRANNYFKEHYVTETENGPKPMKFTDMYSNFNGVMLNILDMLYLTQTDADGDLRRILVPFDAMTQVELGKMNDAMQNYDFLCKSDPESEVGKMFARVENWHLDYVKDEAKSAATRIEGPLKITVTEFKTDARNAMIIKNIKAKGNIGIITTSQWKVQALADYLVNTGHQIIVRDDLPPVSLTKNDRNAICLFYQTVFTQDGCVRALKGTKDLGKCSLDELANNGPTKWQDPNTLQWIEGTVRDMVREEAINNGYEDIIEKFFGICDYWRDTAGITMKDNGSIGPELDLVSEEAETLNAYISLCNGSKYIAIDRHSMFERLVSSISNYISEKKLIRPLVPYLEKILKRNKEKGE